MTQRIVVIVCALAIVAASLTALAWERAKPTAGELQARDVSAAAQAALDVAKARTAAGELPAREGALTFALWSIALAGAIVAIGGGLALVRAAHLRAGLRVVDLTHPVGLVGPAGAVVLSGRQAETVPQAIVAAPQAPMIQSPERLVLPAPSYAALLAGGWRPTADNLILGVAQAGPIYGRLADLLSCGVLGRPGSGKTSLLRLVAVQACAVGVRVVAFDPHGGLDLVGVEVASSMGEIADLAGQVMGELDRRIAQRRAGQPLLVLADELPAWAAGSESGRQCLRRIVLEGRKYGCYTYIGGQTLPAGLLDGIGVRDSLSSRYVFRSSPTVARQMIETEPARRAIALEPGQALLDCARTAGPTIVSIPWVEAGSASSPVEVLPGSTTGVEALPGSATHLSDLERVQQLMAGGLSKTAAIRAVTGLDGGRRWADLAAQVG